LFDVVKSSISVRLARSSDRFTTMDVPIIDRMEHLYREGIVTSELLKSDLESTWKQVVQPEMVKLDGQESTTPQTRLAIKRIIRRFNLALARASEDIASLNEQMLSEVNKRVPGLTSNIRTKEVKAMTPITISSDSENEEEDDPPSVSTSRTRSGRSIKAEPVSRSPPAPASSNQFNDTTHIIETPEVVSDADSNSSQKTVFLSHRKMGKKNAISLNSVKSASVFSSEDEGNKDQNEDEINDYPDSPETMFVPNRPRKTLGIPRKVKTEKITPVKTTPSVVDLDLEVIDSTSSTDSTTRKIVSEEMIVDPIQNGVDDNHVDLPDEENNVNPLSATDLKATDTDPVSSDEDMFASQVLPDPDPISDDVQSIKSEDLEEVVSHVEDETLDSTSEHGNDNENISIPDKEEQKSTNSKKTDDLSIKTKAVKTSSSNSILTSEKSSQLKANRDARKALLESSDSDFDFNPCAKKPAKKPRKNAKKEDTRKISKSVDVENDIKLAQETRVSVLIQALDEDTLSSLKKNGSLSYLHFSGQHDISSPLASTSSSNTRRTKKMDPVAAKLDRLFRG